ncbi:hypothetical protein GP486_003995 [Trichoglossum hirsutum]|uniref:Uncharacterized protein n=1 Tax=Trichoglossum hirsutum TaxID=265104 RepID=A0A9P8LC81_9PEZI|nr:hypothetical protein GP486_003995 [Trichoglossum hirsutum]
MAGGVRKRVANVAKVAGWITTMPWICLQAAIEQILQEQDVIVQSKQLNDWRKRKNKELEMVTFAGTLIASAVTGSIQWSALGAAHWLVSAAWYSTLLFSLVSVIMAFYLSILLTNLSINNDGDSILLKALCRSGRQKKSRWTSLFALQMPIMLLSYALMMYIVGLSLLVIRPLWHEPWGNNSIV